MTPFQIRYAGKLLGMSCSEFAAALGFTGKSKHITVWRWERGKRVPSAQTVALLRLLTKGSMSPVVPNGIDKMRRCS